MRKILMVHLDLHFPQSHFPPKKGFRLGSLYTLIIEFLIFIAS